MEAAGHQVVESIHALALQLPLGGSCSSQTEATQQLQSDVMALRRCPPAGKVDVLHGMFGASTPASLLDQLVVWQDVGSSIRRVQVPPPLWRQLVMADLLVAALRAFHLGYHQVGAPHSWSDTLAALPPAPASLCVMHQE